MKTILLAALLLFTSCQSPVDYSFPDQPQQQANHELDVWRLQSGVDSAKNNIQKEINEMKLDSFITKYYKDSVQSINKWIGYVTKIEPAQNKLYLNINTDANESFFCFFDSTDNIYDSVINITPEDYNGKRAYVQFSADSLQYFSHDDIYNIRSRITYVHYLYTK